MNDKQIERYLNGSASDAERLEVEAWFEAKGEALPQPYGGDPKAMDAAQERTLAMLQQRTKVVPMRRRLYRYAVAASILLAIGAATYFGLQPKKVVQTAQLQKNDIAPGHNQATLTLANGKKIILTKGLRGILATQGKTTIKAGSNAIAYNNTQQADQLINYNTLSTAKGEQSPYPLVLADGTRVWLNAMSTLKFPQNFTGLKERTITLEGEAYFEVAHDKSKPFKVKNDNTEIGVLGTHFNVNAYTDESDIKVTLLEGSVKISLDDQKQSKVLKPGEQAVVNRNIAIIADVDLKQVMAWKNGLFQFHDADLPTVLRQLSRWYDVEVKYEAGVPEREFEGKMQRDLTLGQVLKILEKNQVHLSIEGNKIMVKP
jgi:ferric-dicitrate binding protein FerR (iron transport regulator)